MQVLGDSIQGLPRASFLFVFFKDLVKFIKLQEILAKDRINLDAKS